MNGPVASPGEGENMWTRTSYDAVHDWIDESKREAVKTALRADGLDDVIERLETAPNMGVWYAITGEAAAAVGAGVVADSAAVADRELSAAAAAMGRKGGSARTEAKAAASRRNGEKGGAPKAWEKLASAHTRAELVEAQKGISLAIDRASGLELAALRRRYWTYEKAIDSKR